MTHQYENAAAPGTPPPGFTAVYAKSDKMVYSKDDAGNETVLGATVNAFLLALIGLSTNGIIVRTGSGSAAVRVIQGTAGKITVTNGDGVAADPALTLADTAVTPGTYGGASSVPQIVVDQQGRITSASSVAIALALSAITDVTISAANLNTLDDGANTTLHFHDADRARANHTGTQLAATISDFNSAADARVALKIEDTIVDGVTTKAPSQNAVFDALYSAPDKVADNVVSVAASPYTVLITDKTLLVSVSGACTVNLPSPTVRRQIRIKDTAGTRQASAITVVRNGSESIDGIAASRLLQTNYGSWVFESDGANWFITG